MKRTLTLALSFFFSFFLAASLPLSAQRGGGHAGGGGHAMSGGHGGFSGHSSFGGSAGGHAFSGAHSGGGFTGARSFQPGSFQRRSLQRGSSFRGSSQRSSSRTFSRRGFNRNGNIRLRTGLRNCFGFACRGFGYPWGYSGFYDPYWWWDSGSSYDQDQQDEIGIANEMNQQSLDEQRMRRQDARNNDDQNSYAQSDPPAHHPEPAEAVPATVLVFRDQHKREVQNYAIVGQTLWNFAPQHTEKIPLSDLDLSATSKANEDRGVNFRLPGSGEGQ